MVYRFAAAAMLALSGCTSIDNKLNNDALAQYNAGNCALAYQEWKDLAYNKQNIYGINNLGLIYEKGCPEAGIEPDHKLAFELYDMAASGNLPTGINNVGASYEFGIYVQPNKDEAVKLYKLAARYGNGLAKQNLQRLGMPIPPADLLEGSRQASSELFGEFLKIMAIAAGAAANSYSSQPSGVRVQRTSCNSSGSYGTVYTNCTTY